jgi:hypothetical protein
VKTILYLETLTPRELQIPAVGMVTAISAAVLAGVITATKAEIFE